MSGSAVAKAPTTPQQISRMPETTLACVSKEASVRTGDALGGSQGSLCIGIAMQVCGTDLNGQDFAETAQTERVSRHGAFLLLNRFLGPDQQIVVRRAGSRTEASARVVGQVGIRPDGYVYGIELETTQGNFWGVHFPPVAEETAPIVIRCSCCRNPQCVRLDEVELAVLEANGILSWACDECCAITFWQAASEEEQTSVSSGKMARNSGKTNRRRNVRTSMKASACLCQPTGLRDVARVIDVSRGGISFRSLQHYTLHSWVELSAPYTEGGANIFVPGRIVWERPASYGFKEYGVQYVRN